MNLVLKFLGLIAGYVARELEQLVAAINTWAAVEHNADGTHQGLSETFYTPVSIDGSGHVSGLYRVTVTNGRIVSKELV